MRIELAVFRVTNRIVLTGGCWRKYQMREYRNAFHWYAEKRYLGQVGLQRLGNATVADAEVRLYYDWEYASKRPEKFSLELWGFWGKRTLFWPTSKGSSKCLSILQRLLPSRGRWTLVTFGSYVGTLPKAIWRCFPVYQVDGAHKAFNSRSFPFEALRRFLACGRVR